MAQRENLAVICLFDKTPQATLNIDTTGKKPSASDCIVLNKKDIQLYIKRRAHAILF